MNYYSHLILFSILLGHTIPAQPAWRLGKPRKTTPTVVGLNTYTLSPICLQPGTVAPIQVKALTKAIQHHKQPESAQIIVHKKTETEPDRTKFIKGYSTVTRGVPTMPSAYLTIVSRGYARLENPKHGLPRQGGGIIDAYTRLRDTITLTPIISFDLPDDRRSFNFGQTLDQACLKTVYDEVVVQNPTAKIILSGDCRGSLNVLKFATTNPQNLDALVLLSPFVSAKEVTNELAKNYLHKYFGTGSAKLLHNFFLWWFPNYDPAQDNLIDHLANIKGKKIIIGHRANDHLIADTTVRNLAAILKKENDVYLAIINDTTATHSRLMGVPECQAILNAFYEKYGMPYDALQASQGKAGLAASKAVVEQL